VIPAHQAAKNPHAHSIRHFPLQNPSWFPASSGNHEGVCKCLLKNQLSNCPRRLKKPPYARFPSLFLPLFKTPATYHRMPPGAMVLLIHLGLMAASPSLPPPLGL